MSIETYKPGMTEEKALDFFGNKLNDLQKEVLLAVHNAVRSDLKEPFCKEAKKTCDKFSEVNSDSMTAGYVTCCDYCGQCPGLSWWAILLIIFVILGMCASGAAAFWFFYWNRKHGGQEEKVEEDDEENTESTENQKSVIEIPIGTY